MTALTQGAFASWTKYPKIGSVIFLLATDVQQEASFTVEAGISFYLNAFLYKIKFKELYQSLSEIETYHLTRTQPQPAGQRRPVQTDFQTSPF